MKNHIAILLAGLLTISVYTETRSQTALKDVFKGRFLIGAAVNRREFSGDDETGAALIKAQFNSITPENNLKWEAVHPSPGTYTFDAADTYVDFGEKNGMFIIGHTLVWHNQTPRWVFEDSTGKTVDRETLLKRMHDHIQTVVGRYKGRIKGWDVVNEALNEDGSFRETPWFKIIGDEYLVKAYQFAHEADPDAQLYYNDYSLENSPKRNGAIRLLKMLQAAGVNIAAVGTQGHYKMDWPRPEMIDSAIAEFSALGVKVNITELDIDVVPATQANRGADLAVNSYHVVKADVYADGLPDSEQAALAKRYGELFAVFVKHAAEIGRVTFWGVTDGDSWLNTRGRVNYPLLFDRSGKPKPAFNAVVEAGQQR